MRSALLALVVVCALFSRPAGATPLVGGIELLDDTSDSLSLAFGGFDMVREASDAGRLGPSPALEIDYRWGRKFWGFGPLLGVLGNANQGVLGYGGTYIDLARSSWVLTPFAAAGGYRRGEGKLLGGVFNFYVGGTLAYRFANGMRLGLMLTHASNARIHYLNPGAESLWLATVIPIGESR